MKKKLHLPFLLLALVGCNTNERLSSENKDTPPNNVETTFFDPKIDKDRALEIAQEVALKFSDNELIKKSSRRVFELIPITSNYKTATKGGSEQLDTLLYVFNYADSMGYVFISTDERTGDVIAFIERGNFNTQDTSKSELTNFLVSLMLNYQRTSLAELQNQATTKGVEGPIGTSGGRTYATYLREHRGAACGTVMQQSSSYDYSKPSSPPYEAQVQGDTYYRNKGCIATREFREPDTNIGPLLTTVWGQGEPFNNNAPKINGKATLAGCTAVATAQVMVYHSYPINYPTNIYNGKLTYIASLRKVKTYADFTSQASKLCVAEFMRAIGDLIGNEWGLNGSPGSQYNVPSCFAKMGYKNTSSVLPYNNIAVINSLANLRPVIAIGYREENSELKGHVWVIDGLKIFNSGYDNYYFDEYGNFNGSKFGAYRNNKEYINCNFGWDGDTNDGYYINGIFKTTTRDYKYRLEIIPNIHK